MAGKIIITSSLESDLSAAFRSEEEYARNFLSDRAARRLWLIGSSKTPPRPRGELMEIARNGHRKLNGYLVKPKGKTRGAVAVAHDIFGITEEVMLQCDRLAEEGFYALAPDLFWLQTETWRAQRTAADVSKSLDLAKTSLLQNQISNTVTAMQTAIDVLGIIGKIDIHALGYDFGGSIAWLAAEFCHGLTSAVCFYGPHIKVMDRGHPKCPTLLHLSEKDMQLPLDWVRSFAKRRSDVAICTYDAGPGFASDRSATRDEGAASRAAKKTIDWFNGGYRQFSNSLSDENLAQQLQSRFFETATKDWPMGANALLPLTSNSTEKFVENWLNKHTDIRRDRQKAVADVLKQQWHNTVRSNVSTLVGPCQREIFPGLNSPDQLEGSKVKIEQWVRQRYPQIDEENLKVLAHYIDSGLWRSVTA